MNQDRRELLRLRDGAPRAAVWRRWGPIRPAQDVRGEGFVLRVYRPDEARGDGPGVLVMPGSTGVSAMAPTAPLLAAHGYITAVLGYMQEPGLPPSLEQIPVEAISPAWARLTRCPALTRPV